MPNKRVIFTSNFKRSKIMSIDKAKVIARIKALHPKTNLSNARLDEISARLIKKLNDDADDSAIDEAIGIADDYNPFSEIARNDDRIRDLEAKAKPAKPTDDPKPQDKIELPSDTPEWAKALLKQNQELSEKVNGFEKGQQHKSLSERFNSDERVKNIPDFMRRGYTPQTEEEFEKNITELSGAFTKYAEDNKLSILGNDNPSGAQGTVTTKKEASEQEVADVLKLIPNN